MENSKLKLRRNSTYLRSTRVQSPHLTAFSLCSFVRVVKGFWRGPMTHSIWNDVRTSKLGLDSGSDPQGVSCGPNGPHIGPIRLLRKTALGFLPRPAEELDFIFSSIDYPIHFKGKQSSLQAIADALNDGDEARAWFTMTYMGLPVLPDEAMVQRLLEVEALLKASPDDSKHPGWPAGTPGGLGGKFRPKTASEVPTASKTPKTLERATQRAARRIIRGRLVDYLKRTTNLEDEFEEKMDALGTPLLLDDVGQLVEQAEEIEIEAEAAANFVAAGPRRIDELKMANSGESFSSYDAFLKGNDEHPFEKRFGPAGDGYQYHHIVETGVNQGTIPESQLQNTDNIIRIPTLLHEEISAAYGRAAEATPSMTVRQWLKTQPFQVQYEYGLKFMRELGILR